MVVVARDQNGNIKEVTNDVYSSERLIEGMNYAKINYMENGIIYTTTVPVTVSAFDANEILKDFYYTDNSNDTYTINGWKGTYNGETSTEIIIPNYECIIL